MKKSFIIAFAAGIALLAGCTKEAAAPEAASGTRLFTLTAVLPGDATKTAVDSKDNTKVVWKEGDTIKAFSQDGVSNLTLTLIEGAGTTLGLFGVEVEGEYLPLDPEEAKDYAFAIYPNVRCVKCKEDGKFTYSIPVCQEVPAGSFDSEATVMIGKIEDGMVKFQHAASYLKVIVPEDVENLYCITIWTNKNITNLTGSAYFDATSGEFTEGLTGFMQRVVEIHSESGKTFTAGGAYYVSVFPFSDAISMTYTYIDNTTHKAVTKTKRGTETIDAKLGHVITIGAVDMSEGAEIHTATQLVKKGPFFADFNVGSTIDDYGNLATETSDNKTIYGSQAPYYTENVGGLYPWHNPEKNARLATWGGSITIDIKDVAEAIWGYNWTENLADMFWDLTDKDYYDWTYFSGAKSSQYCDGCTLAGYKVTAKGKDAYTSNSIFLPLSGIFNHTTGLEGIGNRAEYWAIDMDESEKPFELFFNENGDRGVYTDEALRGCAVRGCILTRSK